MRSRRRIAQILLRDWDPLGVRDAPEARDEYDTYVSAVYRLLHTRATPEAIAAHLLAVETEAMGLSSREVSDLIGVARKLRALGVRLSRPQGESMDARVERILAFLNQERRRATYGAVGEALARPPQMVGALLGERRPEASWVVNAETFEPTGYEDQDRHPALHERTEVITSGVELLRRMLGFLDGDDAR